MFKDVGKALKIIAKIFMWIGIVCCALIVVFGIVLIICGIVLLHQASGETTSRTAWDAIVGSGYSSIISGIELILGGIVATSIVIIKILPLYGYGELIQNSAILAQNSTINTQNIALIAKNTLSVDTQAENNIPVENQVE